MLFMLVSFVMLPQTQSDLQTIATTCQERELTVGMACYERVGKKCASLLQVRRIKFNLSVSQNRGQSIHLNSNS